MLGAIALAYFCALMIVVVQWAKATPTIGPPQVRVLAARLTMLLPVPPLLYLYLAVLGFRWLWREAFPTPPVDPAVREAEREVEEALRRKL